MATEDLCAVCADSLDFTGFGPCGHKDACSRCVARLRFVMEDTKCIFCKQDCPQVFFTRYMGDYTDSLAPDQFAELPSRARAREVYELPEVSGYFDDQEHFKTVKALCSYTHPMLPGATFSNLATLKRKLQEQHKLHFCDLCIKGRKVFISEQVLYTKGDLDRHHRTGDDVGPLAESGFKGHPLCRFCRQRFYDSDELFKHMEGRHEHCFLCRRLYPGKFIYFKDYRELEEHFTSQHHPCPHPECLERKFVVFAEDAELKRHYATEHAGDSMSRAQRRQALTLNIQLNYTREQELAAEALARPGVVIGGGQGLPRRGGGGGGGGMRHSRSDGAMAAAVAASLETQAVESAARASAAEQAPGSVSFSADDFPSVSGGAGTSAAALGTWVGSGTGPSAANLRQEDFPALPTLSRNQRRKQRERSAATIAGRLAAASAPIRVVNRAVPQAAAAAPPASPAAAAPAPATAGSSSAAAAAAGPSAVSLVRHSSSTGNLASAAAAMAAADGDGGEPFGAPGADSFPALPGSGAAATQAHPAWVPVRRAKPPRPAQPAAAAAPRAPAVPSSADFPSLATTLPPRQAAGSRGGSRGGSRNASPAPARAAAPAPAPEPPAPAQTIESAVAAAGGVSEELKAANRQLIERCKAALSDRDFKDFREQSAAFMHDKLSAERYHARTVQLGLQQLVPQLAALCPDAGRRSALLEAHRRYLESDQLDAPRGKGWVPPEAALAALQEAEQKGSWTCERCTLVNAPTSRACEVCDAPRPKAGASAAAGPRPSALSAASGSSSSLAVAAAAARPSAPSPASSSGGGSAAAAPAANGTAAAKLRASIAASSSAAAAAAATAAATAAAAAAPPPTNSRDSWPSLAGPGGQGGGAQASSSSAASPPASPAPAQQQQQQQQQAPPSPPPQPQPQQAGGKKSKKGTKTSLQELLASGRTAPGNAWSQTQRRDQVLAAPPPQQASLGQWGKQGGAKLAKKISAIDEAWSK